jgi:DNA-binding FadR family transcriptional regulator
MEFTKVENLHAYRAIVDQVCDAILRGDLQINDRLPSERDMAAQTGLSRSSVREAFRVLKKAGLVEMTVGAGGGTTIISDAIPSELLSKALETSQQHLLDLSETRIIIELSAVELAASRATKKQIADIRGVIEDMKALERDKSHSREKYRSLDLQFHQLVMKATRNEVLQDIYTSILPEVLQAIDMVNIEEMLVYGIPTMEQVADSLENRNPLDARAAMYLHVTPLTDFIKRGFGK